jgi:hypothetical protein
VTGTTLTGTSGDDIISIDPTGFSAAGVYAVTISAGGGTDTIIFDGELAALVGGVADDDSFGVTSANNFQYNEVISTGPTTYADTTYSVGAYEFLTFDNGTVSAAASVTPEYILGDAISGSIDALNSQVAAGAANDFILDTVLEWDGSSATEVAGGWEIQSIEGQASSDGAFISIVEDGVIQGRVEVGASNTAIDVTAENAFHTSITEIGATKTMEIDVVLENTTTGATFAETLSVDVVGVATGADNTFNGTDAADGAYTAGVGGLVTSAIDGKGGDDVMTGNDGNDVLFGNGGHDRLWAGLSDTGNDVSIGGAGNDMVGGGAGNDWLIGDGHMGTNTYAAATDGADDLFGADGDDFVIGGTFTDAGDVTVYDAGNALLSVAAATGVVTLAAISVTGTAGDKLWAGAGDDQVIGAGGNDRIGLGDGADIANAGAGNDEIFSGAGDDDVMGAAGDDEIYGGAGDDDLQGGVGADTIYGGTGDDDLYGNDTTIAADTAVDTFAFETGDGNDTIWDFEDGVDLIDLSALGITSLNELVTENQGAGNDFVIFYGQTDSITLDGMGSTAPAPAIITDADFIFA